MENTNGKMAMFMMENGKMIKEMDLEKNFIKIQVNIMVNGKMRKRKEQEL